jgi:hypothetical protein
MLVAWLFVPKTAKVTNGSSLRFVRALWGVFAMVAVSFIGMTVLATGVQVVNFWVLPSFGFGLYGIVRLFEFVLLAHMVSFIPINRQRRETIERIVVWTLLISVGTCVTTFFSVIDTADLSSWLPTGPDGGAWWAYQRREGQGLGAIGYNHGYVAAQLILLLALAWELLGDKHTGIKNALIAVAGIGVLVSGSRSGMLSFSVYAFALVWSRPLLERVMSIIAGGFALVFGIIFIGSAPEDASFDSLIERQATAFQFTDAANLSGRTYIWDATFEAFIEGTPIQWLLGHGFGSTMDVGGAAHSLPLTYLMEFGLVGSAILVVLFIKLLRKLALLNDSSGPLYWATISLLLGSFSQETFYPATWTGHFLGFFFIAVVITLNALDTRYESGELPTGRNTKISGIDAK